MNRMQAHETCLLRWTDGSMDGWIEDGWVHGWMDRGWMDVHKTTSAAGHPDPAWRRPTVLHSDLRCLLICLAPPNCAPLRPALPPNLPGAAQLCSTPTCAAS
eukprot:364787-Chlamydomonas_euryale.AAC.21